MRITRIAALTQVCVSLAACATTLSAVADEAARAKLATVDLAEKQTLTVAVVSSVSVFCEPETNLAHFEELVEEAKEKGARLVCFPELALMSYTNNKAGPFRQRRVGDRSVGSGRWANDRGRSRGEDDRDHAGSSPVAVGSPLRTEAPAEGLNSAVPLVLPKSSRQTTLHCIAM